MKTLIVKPEDFKPEQYVLTIICPYCHEQNYIDTYYRYINREETCVKCGKTIKIVTKEIEK